MTQGIKTFASCHWMVSEEWDPVEWFGSGEFCILLSGSEKVKRG